MPITPETKDWTWVLEAPCSECGVVAAEIPLDGVDRIVRSMVPLWADVLAGTGIDVRPDDSTWSPLEYACHVRDVLRLYDHRLHLMLTEDGPHYPNWDQDASAVDDRYIEQDPSVVAAQLAAAAEQVAASFDAVAAFARYFLHDPLHHLHDVGAPVPAWR